MKAKIIQIDTHDTNSGILYSTEEITKAIDALEYNSGYGVIGIPSDIVLDISKICLTWNNMRIEDGWLVAGINILDNENGNIIKATDYTVKPVMTAIMDENKTAKDITIHRVWVDYK